MFFCSLAITKIQLFIEKLLFLPYYFGVGNFSYLRNICHENGIAPQNFKLYDSKSEEYEHAFLLEKNSHKYLVEWYGKDGCYSIKVDDNEVVIDYTPDEVVSFMENIIIC